MSTSKTNLSVNRLKKEDGFEDQLVNVKEKYPITKLKTNLEFI